MAIRSVDDASLTALADAIRAKGGTSETLVFPDGFTAAIAGIQAGGGAIEPTASYLTKYDISQTIAAYPFKPKYKDALIVWNITGDVAATTGSVTPYAFIAWIINGAPLSECGWISGAGQTTPWADESYAYTRRTATFTLDDEGNLTVATGTWGFTGSNNTCTIYEIPLPVGLEV